MAKRNEGEVSAVPILWDYSTNSEGLHPVKIRVTFQRKRMYYSILNDSKEKLFMSQKDYTYLTETSLEKLRTNNRVLRLTIDKTQQKALTAISNATNGGKDPFSFGEFERKFLGEESGEKFIKFFKTHLVAIESKGQAGTARVYGSVLNSFGRFLNNGKDIDIATGNFKDIDPADITSEKLVLYEDYLKQSKSSDTWISICMRSIRAIYNRISAKDEYLKGKYPFSRNEYDEKYKIPVSSGQKGQTLTKEEMHDFIMGKIPGEQIPENPIYHAKMLFLFSFYGQGLNFKDIALLKNENKKGNTIEFERQKTIRTRRKAITVRIPITKELEAILLKVGNEDKRKASYIFNVLEPDKNYSPKQIDQRVQQFVKTTNKWLKKYCEANKLSVVTTYAARHTFASIAKVHLPLAQLSAMLGHSKIETTQIYLGRFEDEDNRKGLLKVFKGISKKQA